MIAFKTENRIPSVSLYEALYDIIHQFKNAAQISFKELELIDQVEYDDYLYWMNLKKFYFKTFDEIEDETLEKPFYIFGEKL